MRDKLFAVVMTGQREFRSLHETLEEAEKRCLNETDRIVEFECTVHAPRTWLNQSAEEKARANV